MKNKTSKTPVMIEQRTDELEVKTPTAELGKGPLLGRPIDPFSVRQRKINDLKNRKALNGGFLPLGRPKVEGSKRQAKLEAAMKRKAEGIEGKRGRPKMTEEMKAVARELRKAAYEAWLANQPKPTA